jgi:hypothetical protein
MLIALEIWGEVVSVRWKVILAAALFAVADFYCGRYTVTQQGVVAFVVDRFTGPPPIRRRQCASRRMRSGSGSP